MVLRICPTCRGARVVRSGANVYQCPTCMGSGGIPLGSAPADLATAPPTPTPSGLSRASEHIGSVSGNKFYKREVIT